MQKLKILCFAVALILMLSLTGCSNNNDTAEKSVKEDAVAKVSKYHMGGYILFANDFADENKKNIKEKIATYQNESEIPMFIGVDDY